MNIQDIHFQDKFTIIIKKSYHFDNFSYEFKKIFFLKVLIKLELKKIFKKLKKNDKGIDSKSKETAKERLHLVLMQDRANVSADFLDMMRQEIIEVIKKYIDVDESDIDVRLTNKTNEDGTTGAPALYANIPITGIKEEVKKESLEEKNETKEDNSKKRKKSEKINEAKEEVKPEENKPEEKEDVEESEPEQEEIEENEEIIEEDEEITETEEAKDEEEENQDSEEE